MKRFAAVLACAVFGTGFAQYVPQGVEWTLFRSGLAGRAVSVDRTGAPTLRFTQGQVRGTTDCRSTYSAPYTQRGHTLSLGPVRVHKRPCSLPAEAVLERRFVDSLGQVKRFAVVGHFLVLYTADHRTFTFRRAQ